jgi:N-acetylglucosaminyldiphosphoundecaprenol N-acetyl-beta-D-mannosaminyltransferase
VSRVDVAERPARPPPMTLTTDPAAPTPVRGSELPQVELASVRLHAVRERQCIDFVMAHLRAGQGGWIATANLDHLRRLQRPGEFRRVYESASVVVADGMPVVWASRLQGTPVPERVAGSDLIRSLSAAAARNGRSVFLLGGEEGTAAAAAQHLCDANPGLRVTGTHCPPFGFERDDVLVAALRARLVDAAPDVVFVALGSPKQELLIERLRHDLPRAWWMGVGISFSFVAGTVRRAPRWLQRLGLEWAHRLAQEPRRLWARYLWQGPPFVLRLFGGALWRRWRG